MNVSQVPRKPDIIIAISWKEAQILQSIFDEISGEGEGRDFTESLRNKLDGLGIKANQSILFEGSFT